MPRCVLGLSWLLAAAAAAAGGTALFEQARYTQARTALEAELRADPDAPHLRYYLGRTCLELHDIDCAREQLEAAARRTPDEARVHYWLARAYGAGARAANPLRQAWLAVRVRRELERAVTLDPDHLDARMGLAGYYLEAPPFLGGGLEHARREAREILVRDPFRGRLLMARIQLRAGRAAAAESIYRALEREAGGGDSRRAAELYGDYGIFLLERGRYAEAVVRLRRQVGLDTDDAQARMRLGDAYRGAGHRGAARDAYRAAARLDPRLPGLDRRLRAMRSDIESGNAPEP